MECNLLQNCNISYNMAIGNIAFNFYQTQFLIGLVSGEPITIISGSLLSFDINLNARIYVDEFKYYFVAESFSSDTIASGIEFSYKNNSFEDYTLLPTVVGDGYYYTTFSGEAAYPHFIRLTHSTTNTSGVLSSLLLSNGEDVVGFGSEGTLTSDVIDTARGESYIKEIKIYNNNDSKATANIQMQALGNYLDEYLFISANPSGPWTNIISTNNIIATDGSWSLGTLAANTVEESGNITLKGESLTGRWASNVESTTYTTYIFNLDNKFYSNLYLDILGADRGCKVTTSDDDVAPTIEVKSLPKPSNYAIYRLVYSKYVSSYYRIYYRDYDLFDGSLINDNTYEIASGNALTDFIVAINKSGFTAGVACSDTKVTLFVIGPSFVVNYKVTLLSKESNQHFLYQVEPDYGYGAWVYIYAKLGDTSYPINQTGYFLFHYDNLSQQTFKMSTSVRSIYNFSVVQDSSDIWYTDLSSNTVVKLDNIGTILYSLFDEQYTSDLRGCCSLPDGGCWYINGDSLYRLNSQGECIDSILDINNNSNLSYILVHTDGSLFVRDGSFIYRISTLSSSKGIKYFAVQLPYADKLVAGTSGVWVYCTTGYMYYLSEVDGRVLHTIGGLVNTTVYTYGIFDKDVDDITWSQKFPISTDTTWVQTDYKKEQTNSYYFNKELYHQINLTLRANKPYNIYEVPYSVDSWIIDDSFDNAAGYDGTPYKHRWDSHSDIYLEHLEGVFTIASGLTISIDKNVCVFPGYINNPIANYYQHITSKDKWYIKDLYSSGEYDLVIDYIIPSVNNQDFILNFKVTPTYHYNISMMCAFIKRISGIFYVGYYIGGHGSTTVAYNTYTAQKVFNSNNNSYGRIRLRHSGYFVYVYTYSFSTESWEQQYSFDLRSGVYSWNYVRFTDWTCFSVLIDYLGTKPIYLSAFSSVVSTVYWYYNAPKLRGIYLQDYITLDEIYPNNYKSIYIKTDIPLYAIGYLPSTPYDYKLRVWWEIQL